MIALSGKVGASAFGLKIKACTASLNFETFFSISSAEKLSETSQPVRSVSAPRLAPPAMKRRRAGSGISFDGVPDQELLVDAGDQKRAKSAHDMSSSIIQRPMIMARRLFGTSTASATCTIRNAQIADMQMKWT